MKKITLLIVAMICACGETSENNTNKLNSNNGPNNSSNNSTNTQSNNGTTNANNGSTRADLCQNVDCVGNPDDACELNILVTHVGDAGCDPLTGSCFLGTQTRTDCELESKVCELGTCVDLCENEMCEPPEDFCTDDVLTSYSGSGTCAFLDGTCDYAPVEIETDCLTTGQACVDGECISLPARPPVPGDLAITEIFFLPNSRTKKHVGSKSKTRLTPR